MTPTDQAAVNRAAQDIYETGERSGVGSVLIALEDLIQRTQAAANNYPMVVALREFVTSQKQ